MTNHEAMRKAHKESEAILALAERLGYTDVRVLSSGDIAGIMKMMYTYGLCLGIDRVGFRTRFCYKNYTEAAEALKNWDGNGFPPGYWIKQKPEEIHGPGSKEKPE